MESVEKRPTPGRKLIFWVGLLFNALFFLGWLQYQEQCSGPLAANLDEHHWIGSSYYFHLAFVEQDFDHPDWQLFPSRENPQFGRYVIGAVLWLVGESVETPDLMGCFYIRCLGYWGEDEADVKDIMAILARVDKQIGDAAFHHRVMPMSDFQFGWARFVTRSFGILCAAAIYAISARLFGVLTGLLAAGLFIVHPVSVYHTRVALIDHLALAWSALAVLSTLIIYQRAGAEQRPRLWPWYLATGLFLALACGTKMNALIAAAATSLSFLIILFRSPAKQMLHLLCLSLAAGVICVTVFVAFNPALYPDVMGGIRDLFSLSRRSLEMQISAFEPNPMLSIWDRLPVIGRMAFFNAGGVLLVVVSAMYQTPRACYKLDGRVVVVVWWWVGLLLIGMWLPLRVERYVMPLLPPTAILCAGTLHDLTIIVWRRMLLRHEGSEPMLIEAGPMSTSPEVGSAEMASTKSQEQL